MPSPDACHWPRPHIHRYKDVTPPPSIMTRTSRHLHSPPAESAHRLRPFTPPFFHPAAVDEAHPAPPSTSGHFSPHNDLTFIPESRSALPPPTQPPFLASTPPVTTGAQSAEWKARESHSNTQTSIYFVPRSFAACFDY